MIVCVNCKKEMRCSKTGCTCVWWGSHVYAADEYVCESCGNRIRNCNSNSYHKDKALEDTSKIPLNMTEGVVIRDESETHDRTTEQTRS